MRRIAARYLKHLAARGLSPSTIRARRGTLGLFAACGFSVKAFLRRLPEGRPIRRTRLSHVRLFLRFAGKPEEIALPRAARPAPKRAPSVEQVKAFLVRLDGTTAVSLRDRAVAELAYSAALRAVEVSRLRLTDLDLAGRVARIRGKGGRERMAPFGAAASAWLTRYLREGRPALGASSEALFVSSTGRAMTRDVVLRRFQVLGMTLHALRRGAATHCLGAGMDVRYVQELLGHADPRNTQRYTVLGREDLRSVVERRHPRDRMAVAGLGKGKGGPE